MIKEDFSYFLEMFGKYFEKGTNHNCPNCNSTKSTVVHKKQLFIQLRRCNGCSLMYRVPKRAKEENNHFYQNDYFEERSTILPTDNELTNLLKMSFNGSTFDISQRITLLKKFKKEGTLLDFGSNWGHAVWQFNKAGFDASGYDVSKTRVKYGEEKLKVNISSTPEFKNNCFDIVFVSHVLEHLHSINDFLLLFYNILKKEGVLFIMVPDCNGMENKKTAKLKKHFAYGRNHNFAIDNVFLEKNVAKLFDILYLNANGLEISLLARKRDIK